MKRIELQEVSDGYIITIEGINKQSGTRVKANDKVDEMIKLVGEVVLGYKIDVVRK